MARSSVGGRDQRALRALCRERNRHLRSQGGQRCTARSEETDRHRMVRVDGGWQVYSGPHYGGGSIELAQRCLPRPSTLLPLASSSMRFPSWDRPLGGSESLFRTAKFSSASGRRRWPLHARSDLVSGPFSRYLPLRAHRMTGRVAVPRGFIISGYLLACLSHFRPMSPIFRTARVQSARFVANPRCPGPRASRLEHACQRLNGRRLDHPVPSA